MSIFTPSQYPKSLWSYNPIPMGCVLYLPLWHPNLSGPVFKSIDYFKHTATVTNALWQPDGRKFDGADYITLSNPPVTTDEVGTISVWVKKDALASQQGIFCYVKPSSASVDALRLYVNANEGVLYSIYQNGAGPTELNSANSVITIGQWHLVTFTSDGSTIVCYIDGVAKTLTETLGTNTGLWFADLQTEPADTIVLGGYYRLDALVEDFVGYLGEFWIYNRALSVGEILHIYNSTEARYQ